jgi:hypothetical protein
MRIILLSALASLALIFCHGQGKNSQFGIKTGFNVSTFSASINSEASSLIGFHIGGFMKAPIHGNLFFRTELFFSSQGQKDNYKYGSNGPSAGSTVTTVNYLNFPMLLETGKKVTFQAGPQLGILMSGREKGTIGNQPVNDDLKEVMKSTDFSFLLGLGINASAHLHFGARYQLGLSGIFAKPPNAPVDFPSIKNRVFHFFVGYSF